jgi:hypothetical protein
LQKQVKATERLIINNLVIDQGGENFSRSARLAIRLRRIYGGFAAVWRASLAAKRAFCHGIVENQQRLDHEPLRKKSPQPDRETVSK